MRVFVRLLVLLFLLCLVGGWLWWQERHPVVLVRQVVAGPGVVSSSLHMTGEVHATRVLKLAASVGGRIQGRLPMVGEAVALGQLLLQLDATEAEAVLRERQLQAQEAAHQLRLRKRRLLRQQQALADGEGGKQAVVDAVDALQGGRIHLRQAEVAVEVAALRVQQHRLQATMAGVVTAVHATVGEFVAAGQTVLEVASPGREILVKAEPTEAARLRAGLLARVSLEGSLLPPVQEEILRVEPSVRREGNAEHLPVWVSARHPGLPLLLNQQVDVSFETAVWQVAVRVPLEALVSRDGGNHVWRLREGRVHLQRVQLGALGDQQVEIRGGLQAGEVVVVPIGQALHEGLRAQVALHAAEEDDSATNAPQGNTP